jgi:NADPH-dependent 7-cyano-7-deazaguanine reductase QueF-like protein
MYSEIQTKINELIAENSKGYNALHEAEVKLAHAEHELDTVEQRSFIKHEGTVANRTALARLEAADVRLQRDLRKAEANRIRLKIKSLETALMAYATQAKLIASEMKL